MRYMVIVLIMPHVNSEPNKICRYLCVLSLSLWLSLLLWLFIGIVIDTGLLHKCPPIDDVVILKYMVYIDNDYYKHVVGYNATISTFRVTRLRLIMYVPNIR